MIINNSVLSVPLRSLFYSEIHLQGPIQLIGRGLGHLGGCLLVDLRLQLVELLNAGGLVGIHSQVDPGKRGGRFQVQDAFSGLSLFVVIGYELVVGLPPGFGIELPALDAFPKRGGVEVTGLAQLLVLLADCRPDLLAEQIFY